VLFLQIVGWYDPDTKSIGVYPKVLGNKIGDGYSASLDNGIQIQLVLAVYNGSIRVFRSGNQIKVGVHLKPLLPWGNDVNEEVAVLTI
jgi:hypothetical protein